MTNPPQHFISHWLCRLGFLVIYLLSLASATCAETGRLNILFILADDLRPDALHVTGNTTISTPNLDRLVTRGTVFTRATCGYPICHVSRTEMLTGRCLVGADMPGRPLKLEPTWTLWPEVMQRAGWRTVFSGKWHIEGTPWKRGYAETAGLFSSGGARGSPLTFPESATGRKVTGYTGWTFKNDSNQPLPELGVGLTPDTDRIIADRVIEAIGKEPSKPFFVHVNFTAPHDPLHWPRGLENHLAANQVALPANFRPQHPFDHGNINGRDEVIVPAPRTEDDVRRERAVYFSLVENLDAQVGRILKALEATGKLSRTLVIFSADHGLAMGSHGLMGKQNQYEHTINVPLILAGPGIPAGRRVDAQCYLRDLFPTVGELAELAMPSTVQGRSLVPILRGEKPEVYDAIFGYFTDTQRMLRTTDGWKLITYPKANRQQLFHLTDDPNELHDLATDPAQTNRITELKQRLTDWQRQQSDPLNTTR